MKTPPHPHPFWTISIPILQWWSFSMQSQQKIITLFFVLVLKIFHFHRCTYIIWFLTKSITQKKRYLQTQIVYGIMIRGKPLRRYTKMIIWIQTIHNGSHALRVQNNQDVGITSRQIKSSFFRIFSEISCTLLSFLNLWCLKFRNYILIL